MLIIEYKILKTLSAGFSSEQEIKDHFNKKMSAKIPYYICKLENQFLIEELCEKEIDLISQGKHYDDDSLTGDAGIFTGYYCLTDYGAECLEAVQEERFQFWAPFIYSGVIGLLSLIASAAAITLQFLGKG